MPGLSTQQLASYKRDGFIVIENIAGREAALDPALWQQISIEEIASATSGLPAHSELEAVDRQVKASAEVPEGA